MATPILTKNDIPPDRFNYVQDITFLIRPLLL